MEKNELTLDLLVEKKSFVNDYAQNVEYFEFSFEYEKRRYKLNVKPYEKNLLKLFLNQEFSELEENEKLYELKVVPKKNLIKEVESAYAYEFTINKRVFILLPQMEDVLVLNYLIQQEFLPL